LSIRFATLLGYASDLLGYAAGLVQFVSKCCLFFTATFDKLDYMYSCPLRGAKAERLEKMRKNIPFALILVLAVFLSACSAGQASPSPVPGESTAPAAPALLLLPMCHRSQPHTHGNTGDNPRAHT
jgi:hypothetical protein